MQRTAPASAVADALESIADRLEASEATHIESIECDASDLAAVIATRYAMDAHREPNAIASTATMAYPSTARDRIEYARSRIADWTIQAAGG